MPQDSLDHEEVVKGPPECGPDIEEKLHQLSLAREDDRDEIQLQSDIDKTATDLERLVIGPQALHRGNKDEVDGLIPRMVRHGGVQHPPPYPSHHPYQRLPQQRPPPQHSQQQPWQQSPLQQQQQQPQARQQYTPVPGPLEGAPCNFQSDGVTATRLVQSVHQQRFDPGRNASPFMPVMNPGTQGPRETLPPPYPGGAPTGTPPSRGAPQMHPELSETGNVNLEDVLTFIKEDLETDGEVVGPPMTNDGLAAQFPNIFEFLNGVSSSLQYPHRGDGQFNQCAVIQNNSSAYPSAVPRLPANSQAYPPQVPYHLANSHQPLFEDLTFPQPGVRHDSGIDTPDFGQGSSQSPNLFRVSPLDHGAAVTSTGSSQHPFRPPPDRFSPGQDRSPCGEAAVVRPPPDRFSPGQDRSPCGEVPIVRPPPDRFSPGLDRSPCGEVPIVRPPPDRFSPGLDRSPCGEAPVVRPPPDRFSPGQDRSPCGEVPVVRQPPDRFSPGQDRSPCGEAPVVRPPPDRFSPGQDRSPCGEVPIVRPPPDRFSPGQDRSPCGEAAVVRQPPDRFSPGQDGMCTNPGIPVEAPGGSPCSSTSSHLGLGGDRPSSSTEYSDTDEEDEAMRHDEDTVVHYFADLGLQQVREIYGDNKQLVVNNVNNLNHQRQTALYIAVMLRKYDIVYFLLQIGADPNIQCMEHRSDKMQAPIHKAIDLGDTQMVILLLNYDGLDIELQRVCDKKTPLMLALHGHIQGNEDRDRCEIIHHLLNCGASIDKFNESSDKTILMMVIETRDVSLVQHFLEGIGVGMSRDLINRANKVGNTSLHIAAGMKMLEKEEHLHLLTMLIHFGGNTDAPNQDLKTPKDWKRNLFDEIKRQHLTYRSHY
ncbi:uncharacterized protein LOC124122596 [Haliotis rufescens]|uniref:uncharacterized protein LOC124122596 n=1 Tax=Haliotis rufescens TaxID=6454 RepID=UPI00201EBBDF|nr:uncharacterized protein LOC124122596 [Haliotis rufescens]